MNRMNMNIVPSKFVKGIFESVSYEEINEQTKQKTGELKCTSPIEVLLEVLILKYMVRQKIYQMT